MPCPVTEATHTIVTREAEWDDSSRARAMELDEHDRSIDQATGLPIAEAYTNQPFLVHSDAVNYAARAIDRQKALHEQEHGDGSSKWMAHRSYIATVPDAVPDPQD